MSEDLSLFKCLGEALNTEVKFVAISKFKYYDVTGKEIKNVIKNLQGISKHIICLGRESIYILQGDMQRIVEKFEYEMIEGLEIDQKNFDVFSLWLDPKNMNNVKAKKITIIAKFRAEIIKNIMCYYSIYFMTTYFEVKEVMICLCNELDQKKEEAKKGLSRIYTQISNKDYE